MIDIGRGNWTFAGSDEGARRTARVYTLIETCKLNDVDPQAWLTHVLAKLPDHPAKRIDEQHNSTTPDIVVADRVRDG